MQAKEASASGRFLGCVSSKRIPYLRAKRNPQSGKTGDHRLHFEGATGFHTVCFVIKTAALRAKFERLESELGSGPYFAGDRFSHVDVVFGPVFRYFDTFDQIGDFGILTGLSKVGAWRSALADRQSIVGAVTPDYPDLLERFIERRSSRLSWILEKGAIQNLSPQAQ